MEIYGGASLMAQTVKASACNARDPGSIPGSGRCPGEGNCNPLQYYCLENVQYSCKESDMTSLPLSWIKDHEYSN